MLTNVYENAFNYYRAGNYEDARDLANKILSIDPNFEDAGMLLEASNQLRGSLRPGMSEKLMLEDRFKSALSLYKDGRIVDAHKKMEEVVKLSPNNIKAKYWLSKMKDDLRGYYFQKGDQFYARRDLKGALDNFYNALLIKPRDARVVEYITRVEDELRQETANEKLRTALELYAQGKLRDAYEGLKLVLEVQPGDSRANKLLAEVKSEIEQGYLARGKKLYGERKYNDAVGEWNTAKPYTANLASLDKLISRAKEQMRVESDERKRRSEESARKAKEEEEKHEAELAAAPQPQEVKEEKMSAAYKVGGREKPDDKAEAVRRHIFELKEQEKKKKEREEKQKKHEEKKEERFEVKQQAPFEKAIVVIREDEPGTGPKAVSYKEFDASAVVDDAESSLTP